MPYATAEQTVIGVGSGLVLDAQTQQAQLGRDDYVGCTRQNLPGWARASQERGGLHEEPGGL